MPRFSSSFRFLTFVQSLASAGCSRRPSLASMSVIAWLCWGPLSLLPLAGLLFAHWDHIAAASSTWRYRDWISSTAYWIVISWFNLIVWPCSAWLVFPRQAAWIARQEVKSKIAVKAVVRRLRACFAASRMYRLRFRLKMAMWFRQRRATTLERSKVEAEMRALERNLNSHILRLHHLLAPYRHAQSAHGTHQMLYRHVVVPNHLIDELVMRLVVVEQAWLRLLAASQHDLAQAHAYLRLQALEDPPVGDTLPFLGLKRDGWGVIRQRVMRCAQDEVAKQWQLVELPKHFLGQRWTRMQATAALVLLSLVLRLLRRFFLGTIFGLPVWELLVYFFFKTIQFAPSQLDEPVEFAGDLFLASVTVAIFSRPFKTTDLDTVLFDILNSSAALRAFTLAEGNLHDAILDAVLARNELKQRMRELRGDKREAGSFAPLRHLSTFSLAPSSLRASDSALSLEWSFQCNAAEYRCLSCETSVRREKRADEIAPSRFERLEERQIRCLRAVKHTKCACQSYEATG
ncbi:Proteophosphoglycan ppg4 [Rhodotorula toruloides ATCC 204091]|uniref:Proteophosphoglycan ppg4 n=1 Tax=Rhodotorula toruloides TaxID=5286 RepID=A0A2T0ABJ9_RHOTO|nr:Proteophosphoglycan ppg4 [Rhodotorula toruloides ATCC 204091]PRQ75388.1 Proteophosphoglycan ppg4 [Rhodotorula toruloides]